MSRPQAKIPKFIQDELDHWGLPYHVETGKKHPKLFLCGRLAGVFHTGRKDSMAGDGGLNVRAQIRRIAKEILEGEQIEQQRNLH